MKKVNRVSKVAIAALCAAFAVLNVGPLVGQAAKADELENTARKISLGINQKYKTNSKFGVGKVKSFPTIFLTA